MDTGLLGLMMYCAGIACGIVAASWVIDIIECGRKNSWQKQVTADDIEELGRLFKE